LFTYVDSFCGAGGLGLGLKNAGFDVIYSFDNDPKCISTQKLNPKYFSHQVECESITELKDGKLLNKLGLKKGELFLISGGPPCQGFSIQRIGSDQDDRNNLVIEYMTVVLELMPHYFLMENVPGINGKRGKEILEQALQMAKDAGYYIHQQTLDAQDYGVPQRRKRIFVIGERLDGREPTFEFPKPFCENMKVTVRDTIGHLPEPLKDGKEHPDVPNHKRDKLSELNIKRLQFLKEGQGRQHLPTELLAACHQAEASKIGHRNVYGRMSWDDVAPTITARFDSFTRGQFGHPSDIRSVSLREGALLQTFPEDFLFDGGKVDIARQIGNAVPMKLAEVLGKAILSSYSKKIKGS
jgi:DNA (cytosine-5)-methyltransferase 1